MSIAVIFLMGTMFLASIGYGIILPTLPFLSQHIGATTFDLGLALAVFAIAQLMSSSFWGVLADRFGRKPNLVIGIIGYGVASALVGIVPNVLTLLLLRFLAGCFIAAVRPSAQALASDWTKPVDRPKVLGYLAAMNGFGFVFGPVLGSLLNVLGAAVPFFAVGFLSILNGVIAFWFLPREKRKTKPVKTGLIHIPSIRDVVGFIKVYDISLFLLGSLVFSLADASLAATLAYFITDHLNGTQTMTGWAFAINGGIGAILQMTLLAKVHARFGETTTIIAGFSIGALGYFLLGLSNVITMAFFSIALLAFCRGLPFPTFSAAISVRVTSDVQGKAFGFQQTVISLGRAVGPLIAGWFFSLGIRFPYFFVCAIILLFVAVYVTRTQRDRKHLSKRCRMDPRPLHDTKGG